MCVALLVCAGDMSPATAWVLVLALAVAGLGIVAANFGPLITKVGMSYPDAKPGCLAMLDYLVIHPKRPCRVRGLDAHGIAARSIVGQLQMSHVPLFAGQQRCPQLGSCE